MNNSTFQLCFPLSYQIFASVKIFHDLEHTREIVSIDVVFFRLESNPKEVDDTQIVRTLVFNERFNNLDKLHQTEITVVTAQQNFLANSVPETIFWQTDVILLQSDETFKNRLTFFAVNYCL